MSSRQPPSQEPARPRRRADRPTAPAAARASVSATGRALGLVATEPTRRRAQRRARIDLGRAVAASLVGRTAPPLLATPLAAHRAAQLRLASTDPPPRPGTPGGSGPPGGPGPASRPPAPGPGPGPGDGVWSARQSAAGAAERRLAAGATEPQPPPVRGRSASRAGGSAGGADQSRAGSRAAAGRTGLRERDLAAELERLLLIIVHFLPRLAARIRLRAADERLGAWATGLSDPQDPAVAAARERAAAAQRAAISARAAVAANWRQAGDAAQLSASLVSEAVADIIGWIGHGIRSGSSMLVAWLVSVAVAARRRLRLGSAAAGRHVRAGSAATRESLRAGSAATRDGLRAGSAATREGLRSGSAATRDGLRAGSAAAGRGVRGAGAGIAGAAGGLASRIDALADRRTGRNGRAGSVPAVSTSTRTDARLADVEADTQVGVPIDLDHPGRAGNGADAPPAEAPGAVTRELGGTRNGHRDGAGRGRPVLDPADPVEAWWLPSSITDPVPDPSPPVGRRARRAARRRGERDPVVAGLTSGLGRVGRPFRAIGSWLAPMVTAMAAPPNHRRRGWKAFARPVVVALALTLVVATATAVPAGMLVADSVKGAGAGLPEL
ncbi:MAG TPA: hypothetical protein VHK02_20560, partial [Actinomycetota bacterium]|nr:hypothetical protein [Actinomycetota bacterium]